MQAEALALAAESRLGRRPQRRTDLLNQRIEQMQPEGQILRAKVATAEQKLAQAQDVRIKVEQQLAGAQQELEAFQLHYLQRQRPERPNSYLALARRQAEGYRKRLERCQKSVEKAASTLLANSVTWPTGKHTRSC